MLRPGQPRMAHRTEVLGLAPPDRPRPNERRARALARVSAESHFYGMGNGGGQQFGVVGARNAVHSVYFVPGMFGFGELAGYDYFHHMREGLDARYARAGVA